ncbi:hypothetical protein ABZ832_06745 [Streptantibioticus parmotrematis]|uniref:hypothetical protein n=1 Tax=Streptantibioticus parmotrematis TaxID=2873249 RepID=UPI0033D4B2E8
MSVVRLPYVDDCAECARLREAEESARAAYDHSKAGDYRVLARRHLRTEHGVEALVVERA